MNGGTNTAMSTVRRSPSPLRLANSAMGRRIGKRRCTASTRLQRASASTMAANNNSNH